MASPSSTLVSLPLASLIEDMNIYPRTHIDDVHVHKLVRALEAGQQFPALVADRASKRLTDGWHRKRAYLKVLGATGVVDVELIGYATEADMILDAIRRNAAHGRPLDKQDMVRSAVLAETYGASTQQIAVALHVQEKEVLKLRIKVATAPVGSSVAIPKTTVIALKRPVSHLQGQTLTSAQAEAMQTVPGTSYLLVCRQLLDAIKLGLINKQDDRLMGELRELHSSLTVYLA